MFPFKKSGPISLPGGDRKYNDIEFQRIEAALLQTGSETISVFIDASRDYGVFGDDLDYTVELQAAIDAVDLQGGGIIFLPQGIIRISATINMRSGVWLTGQGMGTAYVRGGGTWDTFKFGTQFHWYGSTTSATPMFDFGDGTTSITSAGFRDFFIDMRSASGPCITGSGAGCPGATNTTAIRVRNSWGIFFEHISVAHAGMAFYHTNGSTSLFGAVKPSIRLSWSHVDIYNCYRGIVLEGAHNHASGDDGVAVANSRGWDIFAQNCVDAGLVIERHCDNVSFFGCEFNAVGAGGACVKINPTGEASASPGVGVNQIGNIALIGCLLSADKAATASMTIGVTTGKTSVYFQGAWVGSPPSGAGLAAATIIPMGGPTRMLSTIPIYAADALVMGTSTTFAGNLAVRREVDFSQFFSLDPAVAITGYIPMHFKKVEFVTWWAPQSASAAIRLIISGTATVVGGPVTPGSAGLQTTKIDITNYVHANFSTAGNTTPSLQVQTAGDGGTAPSIYRSEITIAHNN